MGQVKIKKSAKYGRSLLSRLLGTITVTPKKVSTLNSSSCRLGENSVLTFARVKVEGRWGKRYRVGERGWEWISNACCTKLKTVSAYFTVIQTFNFHQGSRWVSGPSPNSCIYTCTGLHCNHARSTPMQQLPAVTQHIPFDLKQ